MIGIWQPIETAPRDGTDIIVYRPKFDGDYIPRVGTDYWMTRGVLTPTWGRSRKDCQPTHWMPFPAPPSAVSRPLSQTGGTELPSHESRSPTP